MYVYLEDDILADDMELPVGVVYETVRYCEENAELIKMEAREEKCRLEEKGMSVEAKNIPG